MINLKVFVSSPGDVSKEREEVRRVIQDLENSHLVRGKLHFEIIAWDDPHAASPMEGTVTPQESVNRYTGRPADCDLTLVILWSRIGTVLPLDVLRPDGSRYESGTVWEYEDAKTAGKPVWLYRCSTEPQVGLKDPDFERKRNQYLAVENFFGAFRNPDGSLHAGINTYTDPKDFAKQLRQHLEAFINDRLGLGSAAQPVVSPNDPLVMQIIATLTGQLESKDSEIAALRSQNAELEAQLKAAVARTLTDAAQPEASPEQIGAAEALKAGDTKPAEALMREEEHSAAEAAASPQATREDEIAARRRAAELAREQGALAFSYDVRAALVAYQRAAEYEPEDTWTWIYIGDLQLALGDSGEASRSYDSAREAAEAQCAAEPEDEVAQHDLASAHERTGNVLLAQGSLDAALAAYRERHAIAEALAARDAATTEWQRDLSVSHEKIGEVLVAQGDLGGALDAYRKSLDIFEALAARDAANTGWQRDLSVSHERIGDVLVAQGDLGGALAAYRKSLDIREALAARDAANVQWQIDVAISCAIDSARIKYQPNERFVV